LRENQRFLVFALFFKERICLRSAAGQIVRAGVTHGICAQGNTNGLLCVVMRRFADTREHLAERKSSAMRPQWKRLTANYAGVESLLMV
jgi:hypothetical protein